ncbi:hypothetical protein EWM64_g1642 [Hericium alpestre]|uniref:ubiquitinyl hydrolase 1 n=1 Tax=Hericium alpestre TaxID=135208 RepID=A0A4Z0A6J9_9AGAM|nr:hypothetical protein EWM64_g1642 [Hericium alpestre]
MTFKRKRRNVQQTEGLSAGEKLKRHTLTTEDSPRWGWVGTEVTDASDISSEHRLRTCGFSGRSAFSFCPNRYAERSPKEEKPAETEVTAEGELADDVIVISDDEAPSCSKRSCRKNPNCLNYLGQDAWEDEDAATKAYMAAAKLGRDPKLDDRRSNIPVGLRNLGATCYANAFIQVWYQDLAFRNGVYQCQPSQDTDHAFELQVTFAALQEGKKSVFNPVKLVESLRLKTYEQQDAQESVSFSKLFMSHLDSEFQKQSDPALKRLIADQFQGVQAYTTTCQKCGTRSERDSDFLEIEVNLEVKYFVYILAYHGHYEATVFDVTLKTWFQFNDESVTKVKSSANGAADEEKPKGSVTMTSKDAYMLIYARRGATSEELLRNVPKPPPRAVDAVGKLNQEHEERCSLFKESTPAGPSTSAVEMKDVASAEVVLPLEDIICEHGRLDPSKADDMKRINYAAYQRMVHEEWCRFKPEMTPDDVCETCVRNMFVEKLYQFEHPKHVAQFDEVREMLDDGAYWISKQWVKDWRQAKPKMHDHLLGDPPPDSDPYGSHVKCEHGGLSLNTMSRIRISGEAYALLKSLFPSWETLSDDAEQCAICEADIQVSREDRQQMRKRAEDEKARLKYMHDNALNGNTKLLENVPCAMIPAQFVRSWRQWVTRPSLQPRPEKVDTSMSLCEHNLLCIDPNSSDFDTSVTLVRLQDWQVLEELYETGRLIAVTHQSVEGDNGAFNLQYEHEIEVCNDCRKMRKSDYDMTEITIRFLGAQDPNPTPETFVRNNDRPVQIGNQASITTYTTRRAGPQRQSQRLRKAAQPKERRLCITKTMSVKDIKLRIQDELNVPTICQRLFYEGRELEDNALTVPALGILANDVLDLREENEDVDLLDEESESDVPRKKKRDEGGGFGGTLLSGNLTSDSLVDTQSETMSTPPTSDGICPACTYANLRTALVCEICDTQL